MRNGKGEAKKITTSGKHVPDTKSNEHTFLDISTIKKPKNGKKVTLKKKNRMIMIDKFSERKSYDFYDTKNDMIGPKYERFQKWDKNCRPETFVRCDHAGKYTKLEKGAMAFICRQVGKTLV